MVEKNDKNTFWQVFEIKYAKQGHQNTMITQNIFDEVTKDV